MLNSFTQYRSCGPGFGAIGHFFSSVVRQKKGPSGTNAPPLHGIKNALTTSVLNSLKYEYKRILIRMNNYIRILISVLSDIMSLHMAYYG
jgi:hypothetical protein